MPICPVDFTVFFNTWINYDSVMERYAKTDMSRAYRAATAPASVAVMMPV